MSLNGYNTGIGSRHTVTFPEKDYWLDAYNVDFSWDESRETWMALVSLANYPKEGGHTQETIVVYFLPNDDKETSYLALAQALKLSGNPWKIRKLWLAPKNRKLRKKLAEHGWPRDC